MLGSSDVLAVVRDLEVLSDGSVWVLNSSAPYFVGFGPEGEPLGAHGRAGRGPDEFAMPSAFVAGGWNGEAWVLDLARHAMIRISRPDADWAEIPLRSEALPPGSVRTGMSMLTTSVRTARLGREIIVPRSSGSMAEGVLQFRLSLLRADLVAFDPKAGGTSSRWATRWTIPPAISSGATAAFPCGIGCGPPAARISCACTIG